MEKSKNIISKMARLTVMLSVCIVFLEADIFGDFRNNIVIGFPYFKGKRQILSNIFIGILGSTLLAIFNELIEYFHSKHNIEFQILKLCIEWEQDIKYIDLFPLSNIEQFTFVGEAICKYWGKIEALYLEYLPFFRIGWYFDSIKLLYSYCIIYKKYFDNIDKCQKEIEYLPKQIKFYTDLLSICEKKEKKEHLEKLINSYKNLLNLYQESMYGFDTKITFKEINRIRIKLYEKLSSVTVIKFVSDYNSVYEKDKQMELEMLMLNNRRTIWKCRWNMFVVKISGLSPKKIFLNIRCRMIEHKYNKLS